VNGLQEKKLSQFDNLFELSEEIDDKKEYLVELNKDMQRFEEDFKRIKRELIDDLRVTENKVSL
jgi:hypothetical protein